MQQTKVALILWVSLTALSGCVSNRQPVRLEAADDDQSTPTAEQAAEEPRKGIRVGESDPPRPEFVRDPILKTEEDRSYRATARDVRLLLVEAKRLAYIIHTHVPDLKERMKDYDVSALKSMINDLETLADLTQARAESMMMQLEPLQNGPVPPPDRR